MPRFIDRFLLIGINSFIRKHLSPFVMATNNDNDSVFRNIFYGVSNTPGEEQDVSTDIVASLHRGVDGSSDLQRAILMSLDEKNKMEMGLGQHQAQAVNDPSVKAGESNLGEENGKEITKPKTLESRIRDLHQMVSFELPLLYDPLGDTSVFIDPPDQQPEQDDESYERCTVHYKKPMRMKKDVLMKFGSSYFDKIFGATNQHRMLRRRGLFGKLPDHVKYVVDLTPPTEGDQAVYLTTELCCSDGVRKWHQATKRWNVSKTLVAGQEEYMLSPKTGFGTQGRGLGGNPFPPAMQSPHLPLEYSPVRHRSAIERVLLALQGNDPQLDSAPKVWTTFAVAKYFDITHSPLTDYIVRWLRASPNSYFLEILPETALRIADGLQCHNLCRDTFAILVGEEALGAAYRSRVPDFDSSSNVHGRKKEQLPEGLKTRVEYASKAFLDRIDAEFASLVDGGMHWIGNLPEFQKLSKLGPVPEHLERKLTRLIVLLKAYVKGAVYTVLCTNFPYEPSHVTELPGDDLFPRTSWEEIWAKLIPRERILTRSFWNVLRECDLLRGLTNLHIRLHLTDGSMDTRGDARKAFGQDVECDKIYDKDVQSVILSLKDEYVKYCSTLGEERSSTNEGNAEIRATSSSLPPSYWALYGSSLNAESEYGSTENLLPKDKENGDVSDMSLPHLTDEENSIGVEKAIHNGSSVFEDEKLDSPPQAFKRLQVDINPADFFHFGTFCSQAEVYLKTLSSRMMDPPDICVRAEGLEVELTRTLVCLTSSEWKYLPMWAGGNDDGSGGVFNDDVPFSHDGFSTAGPKVNTGNQYSVDGNSMGSSFSVISHSGTSHPNTSLLNNNGFSDALPRGVAVSNDGESWASSPTFDSYDMIATIPSGKDADEEVQNAQAVLDDMETDDTKAAQEENAGVKSAKLDEVFDDIFTYSSDEEEDDDGDTVMEDNLSEIDVDEDDTPEADSNANDTLDKDMNEGDTTDAGINANGTPEKDMNECDTTHSDINANGTPGKDMEWR